MSSYVRILKDIDVDELEKLTEYLKERYEAQVDFCRWSPHPFLEDNEIDFYLTNEKGYKPIWKNKWSKNRKEIIRQVSLIFDEYDDLYNGITDLLYGEFDDRIDEIITNIMKGEK